MLQIMSVVICCIGLDMLGGGVFSFFFFFYEVIEQSKLCNIGLAMESDDLHQRKLPWTVLPQFNNEKVNKEKKMTRKEQKQV